MRSDPTTLGFRAIKAFHPVSGPKVPGERHEPLGLPAYPCRIPSADADGWRL